jgi:hypothetical protein
MLATVVACAAMGATASAAMAWSYTAVVTPGSVASGSTTQFNVALTNTSAANPLGSATIRPPGKFTLTGAALTAGENGSVQLDPKRVVLSDLGLAPGQKVNVLVTATAPTKCKTYKWHTHAYSQGLSSQALDLDKADSSLTTTVTCATAVGLEFVNQPTSAYMNQTISSVPFNPTGAPVTVELVDASGNLVDTSGQQVTLSLAGGPAGATLGGTTTETTVDGIATFDNLTLNTPGSGYTLVANSSGLTSATSDSLGVNSQTIPCPGGACTATLSSPPGSPTPSSTTVTTTGASGDDGNLALSVDTGTRPTCEGYEAHDDNFYTVVYSPTGETGEVAKTMTYTIFDTTYVKNPQKTFQLCFEAPYEFEVQGGTNAPLVNGSYVGLLETCETCNNDDGPCQTVTQVPDESQETGYDTVYTVTIPPGEPGDPSYYG